MYNENEEVQAVGAGTLGRSQARAECLDISRAQRLKQAVENVESIVNHLEDFKSLIGLQCNPTNDMDKPKEPEPNLVDVINNSPSHLDSIVNHAHELICELENALR